MILFLFSDKTKLLNGVKIFPVIRDIIKKKFEDKKYTFSVIVSDFTKCFNTGEQVYMKLYEKGESKLFRRTNKNQNLSPEDLANKIKKAKQDMVISAVHYEGSLFTGFLLSNLGIGEKELEKILNLDFSKTFIFFDGDDFSITLFSVD